MRRARRGRGAAKLYVDRAQERATAIAAATCRSTRYETLPAACPKCHAEPPAWSRNARMGACAVCGTTAFQGGPVAVRVQGTTLAPGGQR